jgi:hypothetical protein
MEPKSTSKAADKSVRPAWENLITVVSSKQLHLQEVTVDSRYENYTTAEAQEPLAFAPFFDDESDTHAWPVS